MQFSASVIAAAATFFGSSAVALPQAGALPPMNNIAIQIHAGDKGLDGHFISAAHVGAAQNLAVVSGIKPDNHFNFHGTGLKGTTVLGNMTYTIQANTGPVYLPGSFISAAKGNAGGIPVLFGFGGNPPATWEIAKNGTITMRGESRWVVCDASTMTNAPGMQGQKVLGWKQEHGSDDDKTCHDVKLFKY